MSQQEVAAHCGTTQATVSRWESGNVASKKTRMVAELFNKSPNEFRPDVFGQ